MWRKQRNQLGAIKNEGFIQAVRHLAVVGRTRGQMRLSSLQYEEERFLASKLEDRNLA